MSWYVFFQGKPNVIIYNQTNYRTYAITTISCTTDVTDGSFANHKNVADFNANTDGFTPASSDNDDENIEHFSDHGDDDFPIDDSSHVGNSDCESFH